jgi:hypothetical protein
VCVRELYSVLYGRMQENDPGKKHTNLFADFVCIEGKCGALFAFCFLLFAFCFSLSNPFCYVFRFVYILDFALYFLFC